MKIVRRFHFPVIDSTSAYLSRELEGALERGEPFPLPALATADIQTAGRGQRDRVWYSPEGCLKLTLAFRPDALGISIDRTPLLGFACALAICRAAERRLKAAGISRRFAVHWPNDVYWELSEKNAGENSAQASGEAPDQALGEASPGRGRAPRFRKFSGILLEGHVSGVMLAGIGVNLLNSFRDAPENLRDVLVSLTDLLPDWPLREACPEVCRETFPVVCSGATVCGEKRGSSAMESFLEELLGELDVQLARLARNPEEIVRETDARCSQKGAFVALQTPAGPVSGFCSGLAPNGALMIDGKPFYSGTIH